MMITLRNVSLEVNIRDICKMLQHKLVEQHLNILMVLIINTLKSSLVYPSGKPSQALTKGFREGSS